MTVMTGAVLVAVQFEVQPPPCGTTFTVRVFGVAVAPFESVAVYVMTYEPMTDEFTVPVATGVMVPSSRSNAVAPGSVKTVF